MQQGRDDCFTNMDGKHEKMSTSVYRKKWPTPAEANDQPQTNVKQPQPENSRQCSYRPTLQSAASESIDISFLQPSVVTPLVQTDKYEELVSLNIASMNQHIHIWGGALDEELTVSKQIHPTLLTQLKPCKTLGDGNCLFNAVCLCLGMPQTEQFTFRRQIAQCIEQHAGHFKELLTLAADKDDVQGLIQQCYKPFSKDGWGNMFHLLALAIALKKNVIVYTDFKSESGQFFQRKNKNIVGLAEEFRKGGDKIEQHHNYEPQKGITSKNPICLHFRGDHYTALIPRLPNPVYCVPPATNLPSIADNGIVVAIPQTPTEPKKMARKTQLASKLPQELAAYKAREKEPNLQVQNKKEKTERKQYPKNSEVQDKRKSATAERHATQPEVCQKDKELSPVEDNSTKQNIGSVILGSFLAKSASAEQQKSQVRIFIFMHGGLLRVSFCMYVCLGLKCNNLGVNTYR